jgi:chromosome segregation ATPase
MARQITPPTGEDDSDLEKTDELKTLNVAEYEQRLAASNDSSVANPAFASTLTDESRLRTLPVLPPAENLQDIEAWINEQAAREREHQEALAILRHAHVDAQTRAEALAVDLQCAQKALHVALCRANEGESEVLENSTARQAAEALVANLQSDLQGARQQLAETATRLAAVTSELASTRSALQDQARAHEEAQRRTTEFEEALNARSTRITELETEITAVRAQISHANQQLIERAEQIAEVQAANASHQTSMRTSARERESLTLRIATFVENVQSNEWKRTVWEGIYRDLDNELSDANALLARTETQRLELTLNLEQARTLVSDRDGTIEQLKVERASQAVALEELQATRVREQRQFTERAQALHSQREALAREVKTLEERHLRNAEALYSRETELLGLRTTYASLEEMLRTTQASDTVRGTRVAELEALAAGLAAALQTQTEALQRANELIEARQAELAKEHARAAALEAELQTVISDAREQESAARTTESALSANLSQLTSAQARLVQLEHDAKLQFEQLGALHAELADARSLTDQADAARQPLEAELARVQSELQRETARGNDLEREQRALVLELERTRGALDERDLQLRRLERYATANAQVLGRIRGGIRRGENSPNGSSATLTPYEPATLIPLDDSDAPAIPLARHTTIGRSGESDLCIRDTSISRRHAVVTLQPNGAFIEDLCSVNGVAVNRERVRHARLVDGDIIELGVKRFRFTTNVSPRAAVE